MVLPLETIKVVDFGQAIFGSMLGMMLGDMGADVIKVERPEGEATRHGAIPGMEEVKAGAGLGLDSPSFLAYNRSKRSLAVDLKLPQGREVTLKLLKNADVLIQNFRPGVMEKLGLGYEEVSRINPRIIYCAGSGYGETGPLAHRVGGDPYAQAMGGIVSIQGNPSGTPYLCGISLVDHCAAALAAFGILTALFARQQTGKGQKIEVNLLNAVMYLQSIELTRYLVDGKLVTKQGRGQHDLVPHGPYRAKDRDVVCLFGAGSQWTAFCKVLGLEHLADDPRFNIDEKRKAHREEVYAILDKAFAQKTASEWVELFRANRMRCDPCLNYEELVAHPQVAANEMIITQEHPVRGPLKEVGIPVKLTGTPGKAQKPPPLLGQHGREILAELGYGPEEIEQLITSGVVRVTSLPGGGC